MGKKARTRRAEQRKKDKRSRKERERVRYAEYKAQGKNTKSKRNTLSTKRVNKVRAKRHAFGPCGNIGCKKCHNAPDVPGKEFRS